MSYYLGLNPRTAPYCVTLSKLINLSVPQVPHLSPKKGKRRNIGLLGGSNWRKYLKRLTQCLAHRKHRMLAITIIYFLGFSHFLLSFLPSFFSSFSLSPSKTLRKMIVANSPIHQNRKALYRLSPSYERVGFKRSFSYRNKVINAATCYPLMTIHLI